MKAQLFKISYTSVNEQVASPSPADILLSSVLIKLKNESDGTIEMNSLGLDGDATKTYVYSEFDTDGLLSKDAVNEFITVNVSALGIRKFSAPYEVKISKDNILSVSRYANGYSLIIVAQKTLGNTYNYDRYVVTQSLEEIYAQEPSIVDVPDSGGTATPVRHYLVEDVIAVADDYSSEQIIIDVRFKITNLIGRSSIPLLRAYTLCEQGQVGDFSFPSFNYFTMPVQVGWFTSVAHVLYINKADISGDSVQVKIYIFDNDNNYADVVTIDVPNVEYYYGAPVEYYYTDTPPSEGAGIAILSVVGTDDNRAEISAQYVNVQLDSIKVQLSPDGITWNDMPDAIQDELLDGMSVADDDGVFLIHITYAELDASGYAANDLVYIRLLGSGDEVHEIGTFESNAVGFTIPS